jgi:hypothetical protein
MEKKRTQVPQKSAKVDILPISIYLVVVLYRHKHCRPQKVELDLACRDSTTTKNIAVAVVRLFNSCSLSSMLEVCQNSPYSHRLLHQISAMNTRCTDSTDLLLQICIGLLCQLTF